jgi:predicted O-methyltransferase YrrM
LETAPTAPLTFVEFSRRFGAFRTKNLNSPIDTVFAKTRTNRRIHYMAPKLEIPREFIRLDPWEAEYLFMIARRAKGPIVETGRFNGGSVLLMAAANPGVPIHSIDIKPQNDALLKDIFAKTGIGSNVDLITGDSQTSRYPQIGEIGMLFVDGDHTYQGCTNDLENWYDLVMPGGHIVLHDCYHGNEVMDSVIDFTRSRNVRLMTNPYSVADHWTNATGSMAHFVKLGGAPPDRSPAQPAKVRRSRSGG